MARHGSGIAAEEREAVTERSLRGRDLVRSGEAVAQATAADLANAEPSIEP